MVFKPPFVGLGLEPITIDWGGGGGQKVASLNISLESLVAAQCATRHKSLDDAL